MKRKAKKVEYILVQEAADMLKVCKATIRRWADNGMIKTKRHPINNYRLFNKADAEKLADQLNIGVL